MKCAECDKIIKNKPIWYNGLTFCKHECLVKYWRTVLGLSSIK